ncbi:D-cysteine desulfhydrase [bacterium]|nr:D-cysteine desulfhydrase [bacterium]
MILTQFPRFNLAHLPTPLEKLTNLSKFLNINLYIKRDDLTGLAGGGNKVRKLEFLIGDALSKGANVILTQGAVQSNHVRQTIAAASKSGLETHVILERRVPDTDDWFELTGNVFLDHLLGVRSIQFVESGANIQLELEKTKAHLEAEGKRPYIIPGGGSNSIGALGYVNAALELTCQFNTLGIHPDYVITASGSSGTHVGLATGFHGLRSPVGLIGISVRQPKDVQENKVYQESLLVGRLLNIPDISKDRITVNSDYIGEGYGISTNQSKAAIVLAARKEGLFLDPTYTGKAFSGLIDLVQTGMIPAGSTVVFVHTGGDFGLFAYQTELLSFIQSDVSTKVKVTG